MNSPREDPKSIIEKRFDQLARLYYDYSNEIPNTIIHSTDLNRDYKVRGGWWQAVLVEFEILEKYNFLPPNSPYKKIIFEHKKAIRDFKKSQGRTSPEHIAQINEVIYQTLEHLVKIAI